MFEWLQVLFSSEEFMPHGHCYLWKPALLWVHVISDTVIFLSYSAIPVALAIFVSKRKDLPFSWVFILFCIFIIACGLTHLLAVMTVWSPIYWLAGMVKILTAVASVLTAIVLFPLLPKALAIPSPAMLKHKNSELERVNEALKQSLHNLKQAQEHLIIQEKMASLGGLVAGVAHEVNTPLGIGITASSFLHDEICKIIEKNNNNELSKDYFEEFLTTTKDSSEMILNSLHRASKLITSFKQIAVVQSEEPVQIINVKQYLNNVILSLTPKLTKSRHTVLIDCNEELEIECFTGAFMLVFTNLINNSLLHGFENMEEGKITIAIEEADDHLVVFKYHDNGKGIPIEDQKKIFDPFFTTKRALGGIGLGLHVTYNNVSQKLKGAISVLREPDKGATFEIQIPKTCI